MLLAERFFGGSKHGQKYRSLRQTAQNLEKSILIAVLISLGRVIHDG
jgi:hypothetical protein